MSRARNRWLSTLCVVMAMVNQAAPQDKILNHRSLVMISKFLQHPLNRFTDNLTSIDVWLLEKSTIGMTSSTAATWPGLLSGMYLSQSIHGHMKWAAYSDQPTVLLSSTHLFTERSWAWGSCRDSESPGPVFDRQDKSAKESVPSPSSCLCSFLHLLSALCFPWRPWHFWPPPPDFPQTNLPTP